MRIERVLEFQWRPSKAERYNIMENCAGFLKCGIEGKGENGFSKYKVVDKKLIS